MLLAIDIGNTNIVLGLYQGKKLITHWRLATQAERTADEYGVILTQLVEHGGFRCAQISAIAVSCVVPPMLTTTQEFATRFFDREPLFVGPGIKTGMPILYENPKDVGADRIVNGIAAYEKYRDACIVVDFGTATTIDLISPKGEYIGGAIAPGLVDFPRSAGAAGVEAAAHRNHQAQRGGRAQYRQFDSGGNFLRLCRAGRRPGQANSKGTKRPGQGRRHRRLGAVGGRRSARPLTRSTNF